MVGGGGGGGGGGGAGGDLRFDQISILTVRIRTNRPVQTV